MFDKLVSRDRFKMIRVSKANSQRVISLLSLSSLAACGGGGSSPKPVVEPPEPPAPDFTESPTGTFTAKDSSNGLTLSEGSASSDLIVIGMGGNDSVTTGSGADDVTGAGGNDTISVGDGNDVIRGGAGNDTIDGGAGNDLIWAGEGNDTVSGGEGDDLIIIIGTTNNDQYSDGAITNPAGQAFDLSSLIALSDVNDHSISDIGTSGSIDGGTGANTLIIYGDVDLTGVTVSNVTTLWVNSNLTMLANQLAGLDVVIGDGGSDITITAPDGAVELDISSIDFTGVDTVNVEGDVTVIVANPEDLNGIQSITATGALTLQLNDDGGSGITYSLDELSAVFDGGNITVGDGVTLELDATNPLTAFDLDRVSGTGTIIVPDSIIVNVLAFVDVIFENSLTVVDYEGGEINPVDLGAIVSATQDSVDGSSDLYDNTTTGGYLNVGDTAVGSVWTLYDQDWYAVTLEAGKIYSIKLLGDESGVGTLVDPRIEGIYDSDGVGIANAFNDDGMGTRESFMLFQPTETGTYYISAGAWDDGGASDGTGTYELTLLDVTDDYPASDLPYGPTNAESIPNTEIVDLTGDIRIDALIGGTRYARDFDGVTTTVTYSIPSTNDYYSVRLGYGERDLESEPWIGFRGLTTSQANMFRDMLANVSAVANIQFQEVAEAVGSAGNIRIAWTNLPLEAADDGSITLAWAYYPDDAAYAGDIWLHDDNLGPSASDDDYFYNVVLHELGHAIGLKHPFEGDEQLPTNVDGLEWTVMSYTVSAEFSNAWDADLYPQTLMYYDILALQHLYGEVETNHGDTTYTYDGNERYYLTLWDTGGTDTINFINQTTGVVVDLRGGVWLDVNTDVNFSGDGIKTHTVYLPEEVTIENVTGTNHGDVLYGNEADNIIDGQGGNDSIYLFGGNDSVIGGDGDDTFYFDDAWGEDAIQDFADGEDMIDFTDTNLLFSDLTIEVIGDDTVISDADGNTITLIGITSGIDENDFTF